MTNRKGRALVTGGAGLIGSHLVDLLVQSGYEVTVLDNLEPQTHPQGKPGWLNPDAQFIEGDIRSESALHKALQDVRFLFHQAAFGGFTTEISKYLDVNAGGTAKIFELLSTGKYAVEKVVVASSQAVYGEGAYQCDKDGFVFPPLRSQAELKKKHWDPACPHCGVLPKPIPASESKPRDGETAYALSKECEERLSLGAGRQLKIPVVALRYAVTYGPRQSIFNPYTGVVSIFSTLILNNLPPRVYEDGRQTRDFIFVGDVARANLFVMENPAADFQVFNVGTGRATGVSELAQELSRIYGRHVTPAVVHKFRWGDVRHLVLDPGRLKALGFQAKTDLSEGLRQFAEWMKSQGKVKEYFSKAYEQLKRHRLIDE
ncbi:MAG: NAD-dependent epimerase/dehydratase family protein [Candidatus Omnitrophica bacterium]|nr:NAD-dependent epimerase/dehydratase family protein [Candidatus Omnitrophota bacterium]